MREWITNGLDALKDLDRHFNYFFGVATIAGLIVAVYTLYKVGTVAAAQRDERRLLTVLYAPERMGRILRHAANHLRAAGEPAARRVAEELIAQAGVIEGITTVLNASRASPDKSNRKIGELVPGYFTPTFLRDAFAGAASEIDLLIYRTLQFTNVDVLETLEAAAASGVRIRLLALSSNAAETVLEQAAPIIPRPLVNAMNLRDQLRTAEETICQVVTANWPPDSARCFEFRGYNCTPTAHFLRVDGKIYTGFMGMLATAHPTRLEDRHFVALETASETGRQLATHFEQFTTRRGTDGGQFDKDSFVASRGSLCGF